METDSRDEIPLDEGLGSIIFSILRGRLDTVTVGIVQSYNTDAQTVTVQPAIKRLRENETESKPRELLTDVRVVFVGSGNYFLTSPIEKGDAVILLTPSRSLDNWLGSGGVVDPGSTRIFDLSDAIAIPGILDDGKVIPGLKNDGLYLRNRDTNKASLKLHADGVDIDGSLEVTGGINATGDIKAGAGTPGAISLLTHTHPVYTTVTNAVPAQPGPVTGTGNSGAPV